MSILMTGFKPFLGEKINPSEILVNQISLNPEFIRVVLPVDFDEAFEVLHRENFHEFQKIHGVLSFGQATGRSKVSLESVALNVEHSDHPDESGKIRQGMAIDSVGPNSYFSILPLLKWADDFKNEGLATEVSYSAGTFVCNSLYYKTFRAGRSGLIPNLRWNLFVHVPLLPEQTQGQLVGMPSMEFPEMLRIAERLLVELVKL